MNDRPSETTTTINATAQMLRSVEPLYSRQAATAPTRTREKELGYDVKLAFASQLEFQYKRPERTVRNDRYLGFDLGPTDHQRNTLCFRNAVGQAFFALPTFVSHDQVPAALDRTAFVDVYAFRPHTSVIHVHRDWPSTRRIEAKVHADHGDEWYDVPDYAVYSWRELLYAIHSHRLDALVRRDGTVTPTHAEKRRRLYLLLNLYGDGSTAQYLLPDGGESPAPSGYNAEFAESLVSHAVENRRTFLERADVDRQTRLGDYADHEVTGIEAFERSLYNTVEAMATGGNPAAYRLDGAQSLVVEWGAETDELTV